MSGYRFVCRKFILFLILSLWNEFVYIWKYLMWDGMFGWDILGYKWDFVCLDLFRVDRFNFYVGFFEGVWILFCYE